MLWCNKVVTNRGGNAPTLWVLWGQIPHPPRPASAVLAMVPVHNRAFCLYVPKVCLKGVFKLSYLTCLILPASEFPDCASDWCSFTKHSCLPSCFSSKMSLATPLPIARTKTSKAVGYFTLAITRTTTHCNAMRVLKWLENFALNCCFLTLLWTTKAIRGSGLWYITGLRSCRQRCQVLCIFEVREIEHKKHQLL